MSKAVICDRCKRVVNERRVMHIEAEFSFSLGHYDLCRDCEKKFNDFIQGKEIRSEEEAET